MTRYSTSKILELEDLEIPVLLNRSSEKFYCLLWATNYSYKRNLVEIDPAVPEIWIYGIMEIVHSQHSLPFAGTNDS